MSQPTFHKIILSKLIRDESYFRAVLPYLKKEYFDDRSTSVIFELISEYAQEYRNPPSLDTIRIKVEELSGLQQSEFDDTISLLKEIANDKSQVELKWLMDATEKYCQEKAIYLAIMDAVSIIDGSDKKRSTGIIPSLLSEALSVSFDKSIGHDYFEDMEKRYDTYTIKESKIPFMIPVLDKVTNDGIAKKTLNLILSPSGGGKSAAMCSMAATYIEQGLNVLYITLELAEERVGERIDANLLNTPINSIKDFPKDIYLKKLFRLKEKSFGRLKIKEYPTGAASVHHFRALLDELELKQGFVADVVFVDYMGICASAHYKPGSSANSYTIQKSVAEELRGLAVEKEIAVWSAVQTNRSGYSNSDIDATSIAESIGILMTADFVLGLIRLPELDEQGQVLAKQIKSRYGDVSYMNRFLLGFDRARMKLYSVEQDGIVNETPTPVEEHMDTLYKKSQEAETKPASSDSWDFS